MFRTNEFVWHQAIIIVNNTNLSKFGLNEDR